MAQVAADGAADGHGAAGGELNACRTHRYDHVILVLVEGPPQGVSTLDRVEARFCQHLVAELDRVYTDLGMPPHRLAWAALDTQLDTLVNIVSDTLGDCGQRSAWP